jgi:hypothetical protein
MKKPAHERVLDHEARIGLGEPPPTKVVLADCEEALHDIYDEFAEALDSGLVDRHSPEGRALSRFVTGLASAFEQFDLIAEEEEQ